MTAPAFGFAVEATSGRARAGRLTTPHGDVLDAVLHAGGHQGYRQGGGAAVAARPRRPDGARQRLPPLLPPRPRRSCAAHGGLHRLHGLGRPDPHRLGRVPGVQPGRHARGRRRRRRVQLGLRRLAARVHAGARDGRSRRRWGPTSSCASTSARRARCRAPRSRPPWSAPRAGRPRCREAQTRADQLLVGIVQGGVDGRPARALGARAGRPRLPGLRHRRPVDRGAPRGDARRGRASWTRLLPDDRLRYFMGIGDPGGIVDVIARGVDLFDCVLPTRMARTGAAFTSSGRLNLRNARFADDLGPLDPACDCPTCAGVQPRLPAPPGQPEGDPRHAAAE